VNPPSATSSDPGTGGDKASRSRTARKRTAAGEAISPEATAPSELSPEESARLDELQTRLGIRFRNHALLREAMTHASWTNERGEPQGPGHDNERLEYLGDAVLELVVGEYLFRRFPGYDEGQLTQHRAALVNTVSLARLAERLGIGETLLLGRGAAKTGGRKLPSLLANAFEALIGATFLDQGFRAAAKVFLQNIGDLEDWTDENHKGRLQEIAQERFGQTPRYRVVATGGPGHRREYTAEALVEEAVIGSGRGHTKQAAEQVAARDALDRLAADRGRGVAATAAGAARDAARSVSEEPARVRRRMAEVAADRGAASISGRRRRPAAGRTPEPQPTAAADQPRTRRGLLWALRAAAEALVGRTAEPPPAPEPERPKRRRRGRRGGRGRTRTPVKPGGGP
jgi:ribonuclease-3